jgi:hypothetical protein
VKIVSLAAVGEELFATDVVPLSILLGTTLPAVPLEIGRVEFDSGYGGFDVDSGDEDEEENKVSVLPGDVPLAAETGIVEFGIGNGGEPEADV